MYYRNEDGKVIEGNNSNILSYKTGKIPLWLIIIIILLVILSLYYYFRN